MMTGVAIMPTMPRNMPYGWVFAVVVIVLILLIFMRMYGKGDGSRKRTAHQSGRQTEHHATRLPEQGATHAHQSVSKRRRNRPRPGKRHLTSDAKGGQQALGGIERVRHPSAGDTDRHQSARARAALGGQRQPLTR
jgi:hypothetical protein